MSRMPPIRHGPPSRQEGTGSEFSDLHSLEHSDPRGACPLLPRNASATGTGSTSTCCLGELARAHRPTGCSGLFKPVQLCRPAKTLEQPSYEGVKGSRCHGGSRSTRCLRRANCLGRAGAGLGLIGVGRFLFRREHRASFSAGGGAGRYFSDCRGAGEHGSPARRRCHRNEGRRGRTPRGVLGRRGRRPPQERGVPGGVRVAPRSRPAGAPAATFSDCGGAGRYVVGLRDHRGPWCVLSRSGLSWPVVRR